MAPKKWYVHHLVSQTIDIWGDDVTTLRRRQETDDL